VDELRGLRPSIQTCNKYRAYQQCLKCFHDYKVWFRSSNIRKIDV
jgi:hypothetical protein